MPESGKRKHLLSLTSAKDRPRNRREREKNERERCCASSLWIRPMMISLLLALVAVGTLWKKEVLTPNSAISWVALCLSFLAATSISFTSETVLLTGFIAGCISRSFIFVVTLLTLLLPWIQFGPHDGVQAIAHCDQHYLETHKHHLPDDVFWMHLHLFQDVLKVCLLAATVFVSLSSQHEPSAYIRAAVLCEIVLWMSAIGWMSWGWMNLCGDESQFLSDALLGAAYALMIVSRFGACFLIMLRVEVLEDVIGKRTCWPMRGIIGGYCFAYVLNLSVWDATNSFAIALRVILALFPLPAAYFALFVYLDPLRRLWKEARRSSGVAQVQAAWALKTLSIELAGALCACLTAQVKLTFMIVLPPITGQSEKVGFIQGVLSSMDDVANALGLAVTCGLIRWIRLLPAEKSMLNESRSQPKKSSLTGGTKCTHPVWVATVKELAGRGVTLEALLLFHLTLLKGEVMPSFDPHRSTTNDVVRQAIIPLSRTQGPDVGGRALASVWSDDRYVAPQQMVTHNWSNLFLHLLAAVIADALGVLGGFAALAEELATEAGVEAVIMRARAANAQEKTYWICAFSINQHASICGGYGPPPPRGSPERKEWKTKKLDTVTGRALRLCDCSEPKRFNEDYKCELNKFNELMSHLAGEVEDFAQVVAVDQKFELFSRAWCVAEMVQADVSGIPQQVQIHSSEAVDEHYDNLARLDVQDCKASRPEDKELIMQGIQDIDVFNHKLQALILGEDGLFKDCVDALQRSRILGRMVERAVIRDYIRAASSVGTSVSHSSSLRNLSSFLDHRDWDESDSGSSSDTSESTGDP